MARDIQDKVGQFLGSDSGRQLASMAVNELLGSLGSGKATSKAANKASKAKSLVSDRGGNGDGPLSGAKGLAAGAGAAAIAPVAIKGIGKLIKGNGSLPSGPKDLAQGAASKLSDTVTGKVQEKVDEAGGPSGILKEGVKSALPFGGGGGGRAGKQDTEGVGKGRRMPIQQSVDIGLPVETVYNQWTQFEDWPKFMHRVTRVTQEDPCTVSLAVKIWGKTKECTAKIETQRPDDRIKWKSSQGMNLTGVVEFRELGPKLTRVLLTFDFAPGGMVEKYARGVRYAKRAARADLHRFVAFIEMLENETGAWRGVIEDGELVEDHDPSYDQTREYGSADELVHGRGSDEEDSDDEDEGSEDGDQDDRRSRSRNGGDPGERRRSGNPARSSRSSSRSSSGGGSRGRSTSGSSRAGSRSSGRSSTRSGGSSSRSRSSGSSSGRSSGGSSSGRSSGGSSSGRSSGSSSSGRSSGGSSSGRSSGGSSRRGSSASSGGGGASRSSSGRSSGSSRSRASSSRSSGSQSRPRARSSRSG